MLSLLLSAAFTRPLHSQSPPLFISAPGSPASDTGRARGVAWGDLDGDGLPELYVARSRGFRNTLYHNADGVLRPLNDSPASVDAGDSEGAVFIDFDNDGDLDLHVVARSGGSGLLLRNDGTGRLTRLTGTPIAPDAMSASMACWADADRDGDLDVFLVGYRAGRNQLFRNERGSFAEVALPLWAIGQGDGRACAWGDPDDDGLPDLAVAVASRPNLFFLNRGDFHLDRGVLPGLGRDSAYSYGISWADIDHDGRQDLFVANFVGDNLVYLNRGNSRWELSTEGVTLESGASKGHAWGDYDQDGDLDLYLGSGTPEPNQRNVLYLRTPAGHWDRQFASDADTSAAIAWGDLEGDGDLDLFVTNWGSPGSVGRLHRNTASERDSAWWLSFELQGTRSNRMGIGAHVAILTADGSGKRWQHRWLDGTTGYAGANQPIIHFGVGSGTVDSLVIRWPSGQVDRHGRVALGRRYRATEGGAITARLIGP